MTNIDVELYLNYQLSSAISLSKVTTTCTVQLYRFLRVNHMLHIDTKTDKTPFIHYLLPWSSPPVLRVYPNYSKEFLYSDSCTHPRGGTHRENFTHSLGCG